MTSVTILVIFVVPEIKTFNKYQQEIFFLILDNSYD